MPNKNLKEILIEMCMAIYNLSLGEAGEDTQLSLKMWDLKEVIKKSEIK